MQNKFSQNYLLFEEYIDNLSNKTKQKKLINKLML